MKTNEKSGISLITLIILIIVIIILAAVVIISLTDKNTISDAKRARILQDVEAMQNLYDMEVEKIASKYYETPKLYTDSTYTEEIADNIQINTEEAKIGKIYYLVAGQKGCIVFGKEGCLEGKTEDDIEYKYVGKELPSFGKGTKWYISNRHRISINIDDVNIDNDDITGEYTITFDSNTGTGTMEPQKIQYKATTNLILNSYTKDGAKFIEWNTEPDGTGTTYTDGQEVTNLGDVTLYAMWGGITYYVKFSSNGAEGSMESQTMTSGTPTKLTANSFTQAGYMFAGWNTKSDGSGTSYLDEQTVSNLTNIDGATVTLYAQWCTLKYAVQIYGINQDKNSNYDYLGLSFGPATGDNYNNKYVTHTYESNGDGTYKLVRVTHTVSADGSETTYSEYVKNTVYNEYVTRTEEQKNKYDVNIHEMTWAQIAAVSDKTVFTDCMLCGDTKSVNLTLNSIISSGNSSYVQYGDGAGILYYSIDAYYRKWNPSKTDNSAATKGGNYGSNAKSVDVGGYKASHIRATLDGSDSYTDVRYAGNANLSTSNCLYSCIESELRRVIATKRVTLTLRKLTSNYSAYTIDRIWLLSEREFYGTGDESGTEGTFDSNSTYNKFNERDSYYYISSHNNNSSNLRKCYNENGKEDSFWLRSIKLSASDYVKMISFDGSISFECPRATSRGINFGFCIK